MSADLVTVELDTTMGMITVELNREKAPLTVDNFVQYAKDNHYNGTIFHRVINGFMIQCGGMDTKMLEKSGKAPIKNEGLNGLKNDKYTLAMARTNDPNSATAQFFINTANNDFLNGAPGKAGYAVFGKVIAGTEVVDKISKVKTGNAGHHSDVPVESIAIKTATVID